MVTRLIAVAILAASTVATAEPPARLPLTPGAYLVDGKSDGSCRKGPGDRSLIVETADAMAVITVDGASARVHVDRFAADGVLRLDGALDGAALTVTGGGQTLRMTPDNGAVLVQLGSKPAQKWTHVAAATGGVATGIGGVFTKAKDAKKLAAWYAQHLGLPLSPYGFVDFRWRELDEPGRVAHTAWMLFKAESKHFDGPVMIDYRVDQLDLLLQKLEHDGIKIERKEDEPGNGHFAWIRDGEGNLVELWEPAPNG